MLNEPVLVDTGPLIAFYSEEDSYHAACKKQMQMLPVGKTYTCWPVIVETAYMLRKRPMQRDDFLQTVRQGNLTILSLRAHDLEPVQEILAKYHDHSIDLADACLLHLADREEISTILTINHRHFAMFRKANGEALRLLPGLG